MGKGEIMKWGLIVVITTIAVMAKTVIICTPDDIIDTDEPVCKVVFIYD